MLINLSNHSSISWEEKQMSAATIYGEVIDISFPSVDPTGDENYIEILADKYRDIIMEYTIKNRVTVHLMGEMTFSVALLKRMEHAGIVCIASTSRRIVTENQAGLKEVVFQFERFREYTI